MNRIFEWLSKSTKDGARLEHKNVTGSLVAFHSGGVASWPFMELPNRAHHNFCNNPVVYRCVQMISEAAASISLLAKENNVEFNVHPILELLAKPNDLQTGPKFLECLYGHLFISGNAFIVASSVDTQTRELHLLDPVQVEVVLDEKGWSIAYEHKVGSQVERFNLDEILNLSLFNPGENYKGLSPISSAAMAIDIHNAASSWNKALLDNSARPSGALVYAPSSGDNLTQDQFTRLKQELEEGYTGATNAGRPMLLEGGLDWKAMGFSPKDMDFLEAKNGAAREIALAFGIPPMLLGIPGDNTYSNYQEANRAFWRQTILPLAAKTAMDIGKWLSPHYEDNISLAINKSELDIFAADREKHWQRIGQADFLTTNEKREALGFPALAGLDEI